MPRDHELWVLANYPRINITEAWGEGPLFTRRCWMVGWPLSNDQIISVNNMVTKLTFYESIVLLVPSLKISSICLDKAKAYEQLNSPFWEAFFCLSGSILMPATLDECLLKYKIKTKGIFCAFESSQHEILGSVIAFISELMQECLLKIFKGTVLRPSHVLEKKLARLKNIVNICCAHSLTQSLLLEAQKRDIPSFLLNAKQRIYHLGVGVRGRVCSSTMNDHDSYFGVTFAQNKDISHSLLSSLGLTVPKQITLKKDVSDVEVKQIIGSIGYPCVIKPLNNEQGFGVTSDIHNFEELKNAMNLAKNSTSLPFLLLQQHVSGSDFRLNVQGDRLEFVTKRCAPVIVGNGIDTVQICIEKLNASRRLMRKRDHLSVEVDPTDSEVVYCLSRAGLDMKSIIEFGEKVFIRRNSNISTGGSYEEIMIKDVHPKIVNQCLAIAKTFRLDSCGIDYITEDISKDPAHHFGAFIEVNAMPQQQPFRAFRLVQNLFPDKTLYTIPCWLLLASLGNEASLSVASNLQLLMEKHPYATITCPSSLQSKVFACLPEDITNKINFFSHPKEIIINKLNSELICLMTPELLLKHGWILPRNQIEIINLIDFSTSIASKAILRYVEPGLSVVK